MRTLAAVIALTGAVAAATVSAHHGKDGFTELPITLRGTVIDAAWQNPHVLVTLEVKDAAGSAKRWTVDLSPPNALRRAGFAADALKAGTVVTVNGYPTPDRTRLTIRTVTFPDGRTHTSSNEFFVPAINGTLTFRPGAQ
jgi:hypothetical protein